MLLAMSGTASALRLVADAGYGLWLGTRRKPCKVSAGAVGGDVFHVVLLLGGHQMVPPLSLAGSRFLGQLAYLSGDGEVVSLSC